MKEITVSQRSKSMVPAMIVESKITNMSAVYMDILNILFAEIGRSTDDDDNLSYCISASRYQKLKNMNDIRDAYKTLKEKIWGNGENSRGINLIFIEVIEKNDERGKKINIFLK